MNTNKKTLVFTLLAFITFLLGGCSSGGGVSLEEVDQFLQTPWDDRDVFKAGLIQSEQDVLDNLPGASVYHIDFQISDDYLTLIGWEEVAYTNTEDIPLDEIYFQLFPNAEGGETIINTLTVDGQDLDPVYEFEDTALLVSLPAPLQPGDSIVVRMDFEVVLAEEMAGNYGLFGYFEDILVLDEFYPVIPVYDDEGWNVQAPPPNADTSYFDQSFYIVKVTAPDNLVIAASGIEVARSQSGGDQVVVFAAGPTRDFYLAGSEKYIMVSQTVGKTVVNSYALAGLEEGADVALQVAVDSLASFSNRFGVYPYTEFDVVSTPLLALGIEYPGIVGIVTTAYDPNEMLLDLPFPIILESVIAHEVGHQWFYNLIGNDQIDEPWVDEAMAQYAAYLYYVDMYGVSSARGLRDSWAGRWERVGGADIPIGLPAEDYSGAEYGAIVYGRGPLFVEALAEEIGQVEFDAFLKSYYQEHQWGIATAESFKQTAEAACGCDLTPLFETWVYPQ